jgi:hypothetical protein
VLADLAYEEQRYDEALDLYAKAYLLLGGRKAGYGKRTFDDELQELARRIERLPRDLLSIGATNSNSAGPRQMSRSEDAASF